MIIINQPTSLQEIHKKYSQFFKTMVKAVVDLEKGIIALDAELHVDLEQLLLESGSSQGNLWGINLYFEGPKFIEFTSLINIRPAQGNQGMEIENPATKQQIEKIVNILIAR